MLKRTESSSSVGMMIPPPPSKGVLVKKPPPPAELRRSGSSTFNLDQGLNLKGFEDLVKKTRVELGNVKEAYQHFKRLESSRMRNNLDATPELVLSIMKDQMTLMERRSSRRLVKAPSDRDVIPPPPSNLNRQNSGIQHQHLRAEQQGPESSEEKSAKRAQELEKTIAAAHELVRATQQINRGVKGPEKTQQHTRGILERRQSEGSMNVGSPKMTSAPKRHTIGSPIRKPPPPKGPPPGARLNRSGSTSSFLSLGRQPSESLLQQSMLNNEAEDDEADHEGFLDAPGSSRHQQLEPLQRQRTEPTILRSPQGPSMALERAATVGVGGFSGKPKPPPPNLAPPSSQLHQHMKQQQSQMISSKLLDRANAHPMDRETFILQEKLAELETQLAREQEEKEKFKEQMLAAQRDLHVAQSDLSEAETSLAALRDKVAASQKLEGEQKEKFKVMQLEHKSSARKSRQRFDAAIDFMKGMLVDAKFENLLQVIKSRLRIIVGAEKTEVYIVDHKNHELLSYRERSGTNRRALPNGSKLWMGRFPMDTGIVGAVIEEKTMQVVKEVEGDVRFDALVDGIGSNGVRNLVVYPIQMRSKVVAVVVVANKLSPNGRVAGDDFSPSDIAAIQDFATLSTLVFLQQQIRKTRKNARKIAKTGSEQSSNHNDEGDEQDDSFSFLDGDDAFSIPEDPE